MIADELDEVENGAAAASSPIDKRLARWLASRKWKPFAFQQEVWSAYARGESGLIHAATGTGKTYAAWLGPVLQALNATPGISRGTIATKATSSVKKQPLISDKARAKSEPLRVLWITPLRALAGDTEQALRAPIEALGLPWTIESRTGDTSASLRRKQRERLPTALITTPESLSLLLCRTDHAELFSNLLCVIVDEWHELMSTKRGVQVELCLARLRKLCPTLRTWGLSATLGNLDEAAATLLGMDERGEPHRARIVQGFIPKRVEVEALVPETMDRFPWAGHLNTKLLPQVMERLRQAESAIAGWTSAPTCHFARTVAARRSASLFHVWRTRWNSSGVHCVYRKRRPPSECSSQALRNCRRRGHSGPTNLKEQLTQTSIWQRLRQCCGIAFAR